ncbi:MAG: hypothetical protein ACKVWR_02765 [Acidimicrobiales bacterium]
MTLPDPPTDRPTHTAAEERELDEPTLADAAIARQNAAFKNFENDEPDEVGFDPDDLNDAPRRDVSP